MPFPRKARELSYGIWLVVAGVVVVVTGVKWVVERF